MLRAAKLLTCKSVRALGLNALMARSPWRDKRLLILAYHGTSQDDEHLWDPSLYMPPALLRRRMQMIQQAGCHVLPLADALRKLSSGELPPRSVAITFDDGTYDFYSQAFPILQSFGFPVTVYVTTYYSDFNRPVYDPIASYIIWKSQAPKIHWPEVLRSNDTYSLPQAKAFVRQRMHQYPGEEHLDGRQKDDLLAQLARRLGVDYDAITAKRIIHIMNANEARELAGRGVDLQLHTHRHGVSCNREIFMREIQDNRARLKAFGASAARHFCYPGGVHRPEFLPWLKECGIDSATTCELGLASRSSESLLLPRMVDTSGVTDDEFAAWLSGVAHFLPKRPYVEAKGQFLEERFGLQAAPSLNS